MALPPELDLKDRDPFTKSKWDRAMNYLMAKFRTLDSHVPDWVKAVDELRQVGLQRIDEAIKPAYQRVMNLATFGFLKGDSVTPLTVETGRMLIITIAGDSQRELFTPTEFVTLTRISTSNDWAICRVVSYDAKTGLLKVTVEAAEMSPGEHSDWQVTATAGSVAAAKALLVSTRAARDAAEAIRQATAALREATAIDAAAAMKAAKDAHTAALLIEGGPVSSINGETGPIQLDESYIPGLTRRLEERALKVDVKEALDKKADKGAMQAGLAARYTKAEANTAFVKAGQGIGLNERVIARYFDLDNLQGNGDYWRLCFQFDNLYVRNAANKDLFQVGPDGNIFAPAWEGRDLKHHIERRCTVYQSDLNASLNAHIENRCGAYQNDTNNWVRGNFITDIRLTGGGDIGYRGGWVGNNGGEVVTGWSWSIAAYRGIDAIKTRYLQKMINGNWYAIGTW